HGLEERCHRTATLVDKLDVPAAPCPACRARRAATPPPQAVQSTHLASTSVAATPPLQYG
ncbi:unnamed protein product, partial [Urochloa humidicola]